MNRVYNPTMTILLFVFCVLSMNNMQAQTIIDNLQSRTNASDGVIQIECPPSIVALIGKPNSQIVASGNADFVERNGFRIQVFMEKLRAEASARKSAIENAFPELSADLQYVSPNWVLRVGDFLTREEANIYIQRLRKEFPSFGKEMYVVADKIKLFIER